MTKNIEHRVIFPALLSKPLHVAFDEPLTSSDSGSILLKAVDDSDLPPLNRKRSGIGVIDGPVDI